MNKKTSILVFLFVFAYFFSNFSIAKVADIASIEENVGISTKKLDLKLNGTNNICKKTASSCYESTKYSGINLPGMKGESIIKTAVYYLLDTQTTGNAICTIGDTLTAREKQMFLK